MNCQRCEKYAHCKLCGDREHIPYLRSTAVRAILEISPTAIYPLKLVCSSPLDEKCTVPSGVLLYFPAAKRGISLSLKDSERYLLLD